MSQDKCYCIFDGNVDFSYGMEKMTIIRYLYGICFEHIRIVLSFNRLRICYTIEYLF